MEPLIGRDEDLQRASEEIATPGVVTLWGPAGVGKTRLALELARTRGAILCRLHRASDLEEVCIVVGDALDVTLEGGVDILDRLALALRSIGERLIVLDGFEHVAGSARPVLDRFRRAAPRATFLVTSRHRLGLEGERVLPLRPLALEAAVELFVARAAARRSAELEPAERALVPDIVERLDRIPFAIEVVAAHADIVGVRELAERLPGGQSMEKALAWSWQLLDSVERALLARATVFAGGFQADAVEAVLGPGLPAGAPPVLEVLQRLRDKSFLRVDAGAGRRRLDLYRAIRDFAEARLPEVSGAEEARASHARYYAEAGAVHARALDVHGDGDRKALAWLISERDNLTVACEHGDSVEIRAKALLALDVLVRLRGPFGLHLGRLSRAITAAETATEAGRWLGRLLLARASARQFAAQTEAAVDDARRALSLAQAEGDRVLAGYALYRLGRIHLAPLGAYRESQAFSEEALALFRESGERSMEASVLSSLGSIAHVQGDLAQALERYEDALRVEQQVDNPSLRAFLIGHVGMVHGDAGRIDAARSCYERALALCREVGHRVYEAAFMTTLGMLEHDAGDLAAGRELLSQAATLARETGDRVKESNAVAYLGGVLRDEGKLVEAAEHVHRARESFRLSGNVRREGMALVQLGAIATARGIADEAAGYFADAERLLETTGDPSLRCMLEVERCALALPGEREPAEAILRDAEVAAFAARSYELRVALRALGRALSPLGAPGAEPAFDVSAEGAWFEAPGSGRVTIEHRPPLRRVLARLAAERRDRPGHALGVDDLLAAGWPNERVIPDAAAARVYTAVATLRRLGLREVLLRTEDGYLLDAGRTRVP